MDHFGRGGRSDRFTNRAGAPSHYSNNMYANSSHRNDASYVYADVYSDVYGAYERHAYSEPAYNTQETISEESENEQLSQTDILSRAIHGK